MKTASRILGTAFFLEGYEVQDAPRYGAERRGAPIFAYVRASKETINERGVIRHPDLIIAADETLIQIPAADVLSGISEHTVLLIYSHEEPGTWADRLGFKGKIVTLPVGAEDEKSARLRFAGATCAGAAARLVGVISQSSLEQAIRNELSELGGDMVEKNIAKALDAYRRTEQCEGCVKPGKELAVAGAGKPNWIELPFDDARISAPVIHAAGTSEKSPTGLWRTMRPVIDYERCHHCWWICSTFCPDSAIRVDEENRPVIDYEHCKGCMICATLCPSHAIAVKPEAEAAKEKGTKGQKK